MKTIFAFFRLIRFPNLVFIALTQSLFYFAVFNTLVTQPGYKPSDFYFYLLMAASLMIAAAGYIINDYFDLNIDAVNKPDRVVVDRLVKRRWAILWHMALSLGGLFLSILVSYRTGTWIIAFANLCCIILLWFYSTTFKKKLLSGNIIIAALTAWVILVIYFFAGADIDVWKPGTGYYDPRKFFKITMLYAGFAFVVSLIREVIKDLEDMEGDARYQCRTMPIVWGVPASKVFAAVWLIVCISALFIIQLYAWQSGWWPASLYCFGFIIIPMLFILNRLYKASLPQHYHELSTSIKFIMFAGILSMIFFKFLYA